ncbi:MAG: SRPBCC family protein [bacterium]|nr:SRPBCC family protein [bacterium]
MASPTRTHDTIAHGLTVLGAKLSAAGVDRDALDAAQRELRAIAERVRRLAATAVPAGAELASRALASAKPLGDEVVDRVGSVTRPLRDEMLGRLAGRAAAGTLVTRGLQMVARNRVAAAAAAVAGVAAITMLARRRRAPADAEAPVVASVTIARPQGDVYRFWRALENVPRFMDRIAAVRETGDRRSHWTAKAPAGTTLEWDAEITADARDERIAWRSLDGADVDSHGSVGFTPTSDGRGTVVRVELAYRPPAGAAGVLVARLLGQDAERQLRADLRRLAQLLEAGELATNRGRVS